MAITAMRALITKDRRQLLVLFGLALSSVALTALLYSANPRLFQRFIGGANPVAAALMIVLLGFIPFLFLLSRGWFAIYTGSTLTRLVRFAGFAVPFAMMTIMVDLRVPFPADMNVLLPQSLLFYPVMGFFAEVLFHVLPLSILLFALTTLLGSERYRTVVWVCFFVVSGAEATFQTFPLDTSSTAVLFAGVVVWLNLYVFSLFQLAIFKRYDFVSMYAFRLVYYLIWHIVWGNLRLQILF